jgi:serine/threonine protein kinase/Flp pilus assembly protein TadD
MPSASADRNLLFGILALQMDFIRKDALIRAMHAWVLDKHKPLGQILVEQSALAADLRDFVEALIDKHVEQHGNDPQQSLAALSAVSSICQALEPIADVQLQATLAPLAQPRPEDAPDPTRTFGTPSSTGMRFRRLRPHARGGLGEVFIALDNELNRQVALKEIQERYADQPECRDRFLLEAEITGALEHPGIVPIYGLGTYADGRPFYAMRFIKGDSLMEAIQRFHAKPSRDRQGAVGPAPLPDGRGSDFTSLAFRNLLRRLIDVCNAVQYAHDRGVLHRDLKPGNIMLGKYGETLVVDWGLAKTVGRSDLDTTALSEAPLQPALVSGATPTVMGSAVGTPAYMSPEQAAGRLDLLGPASDVYSLGATLYCLLTGQAPFSGSERAMVLPHVQLGEFDRPRKICPDVPAALEAVCLHAMALRPADRYASPQQLADDLEHWLADEPVRAWPEPLTVKAGRWMRRHKPLVSSTAAAMLVALLALAAGGFWYQEDQNRRAAEETRLAAAAALREVEAQRKQALLEAGIQHALEQAEKERHELHTALQAPGGVFVLLNDPSQWQARIEAARGSLERARALLATAEARVDAPLAERVAGLEQQLKQDDADRTLAAALEKIRMERLVLIEGQLDYAGAARSYARTFADAGLAVSNREAAALAPQVGASPIREEWVAALDDWANVVLRLDNPDLLDRLLELARRAAPDPAWGDRLRQRAVYHDQHALTELVRQAPVAELSPPLLQLVGNLLADDHPLKEAWLRQAQARFPADFWLNFDLGNTLVKASPASPADAAGFYHAALAVRPRSSAVYINLGHALGEQKRPALAIAALQKAIDLEPKLALAHLSLGAVLREQHRLGEASAALQKAIDLEPKSGWAYSGLGVVLQEQQRLAEAVAAHQQAIDLEPRRAAAYIHLGNTLRLQKQLTAAANAHQKAIDLGPKLAAAYLGLGNVRVEQNQSAQAVAAFQKAIDLEPKLAAAYTGLGAALRGQQRPGEAIAAHRKAIDLDPKLAQAYSNLGIVLAEQQRPLEAIAALRKAVELDPASAVACTNLGNVLHMQKQFAEAVAVQQKAVELEPASATIRTNLGNALQDQRRLPEAIAAFRKAIDLDGQYANAHGALGRALFQQGSFAEAAQATQQALDRLPARHPLHVLLERQLKDCRLAAALAKRLDLVLDGKQTAAPIELLQLAALCQVYQQRHASAVRLYQEAFQAQPALAEDRTRPFRFSAARAAALAGTGKGDEAGKLSEPAKVKLRQQARAWLQADLDREHKQLTQAEPALVVQIDDRLGRWQADPDLAGLRDTKALTRLPADEGRSWQEWWTEVGRFAKEARDRCRETRIDGRLSAEGPSQVHAWNLVAGRAYVIDLESTAFDAFLKLQDAQGKIVAENDDIEPGVNLNARLVFTAPADGVYRLVATSFEPAGIGAYTLRIREFKEGK